MRLADGLSRNRLHHEALSRHQKAIPLAIGYLERFNQRRSSGRCRYGQLNRGVSAVVLQRECFDHANLRRLQTLRFNVRTRLARQSLKISREIVKQLVGERFLNRRLLERTHVGQTHAVCGEHAGKRMNVDTLHTECVGDHARMLPSRATEAGERVFGNVIAALHTNMFDRIRHVFHSNTQETRCNFFRRFLLSSRTLHLEGERFKFIEHGARIERLIAIGAKHGGEQFGA